MCRRCFDAQLAAHVRREAAPFCAARLRKQPLPPAPLGVVPTPSRAPARLAWHFIHRWCIYSHTAPASHSPSGRSGGARGGGAAGAAPAGGSG